MSIAADKVMTNVNNFVWSHVEEALTPRPSQWRLIQYTSALVLLPVGIATALLVTITHIVAYVAAFFEKKEPPNLQQDFTPLLENPRLWQQLEPLSLQRADPDFLFGTATCTYQDSGRELCPTSQWATHELSCLPENNRSGRSANMYELYKTAAGRAQIIRRLQALGSNSFRLSVEWSHIEPAQGQYRMEALTPYIEMCQDLREVNIQPMVTLHHFSEPQWWHDLGSFEKEENIAHFESFVAKIFPPLTAPYKGKPLVDHFCTINEPGMEVLCRYLVGEFSPGLQLRFSRGASFLKHVLLAHAKIYETHKRPDVQIGIVHHYYRSTFAAFLYPIGRYFTRLLNEVPMQFFKTGRFEFAMPFVYESMQMDKKPGNDFVGVQFYVRPKVGLLGQVTDDQPMTLMGYPEDSAGIYEAITESHKGFDVPVIITETGISTEDEVQRERFLLRTLYATQRAQESIGRENVRGYYIWSFCDNSEWSRGVNPQRFGCFARNSDGTIAERPKAGLTPIITWRLKM